ncbi:fructosamine kinase family protein [Limosilactobacillus sp.]|jgi:fructosamine-3-kinase|uniref:fructosamine kinase family protein n=1 Tax=Limosilactobacillus sp. TaxID=2773925 RepID=UPI0025BB010C|nr:fructosamine kinase family protein [Limosilactobacillus sp.]MCH3922646.1 fructosamine kinase family protein [Limosilactobacillus sp.]MCH3927329.1 fructosamine kinase family protein [Limosilactobacillus sp.]
MSKLNQAWFAQLPFKKLDSFQPVSGGDINESYRIEADGHSYFIKIQPNQPATYFQHEINGLKAIGKVTNTPTPLHNGVIDGNAYLVLNWLDESAGSQAALGRAVATMHQQESANGQFGFVDNHRTKALVKDNSWNRSWADFYVNQRLLPEVKVAAERGRWNRWRQEHFDQLVKQFTAYYQEHTVKPSLLHGDLWAGNFMFANDEPYLIDPDAVYGDREFDLAMTTVFGGFDQEFYQAYAAQYPFTPGINDRLPWYRFYYLCMHLVLFGESYGDAVDRILSQY